VPASPEGTPLVCSPLIAPHHQAYPSSLRLCLGAFSYTNDIFWRKLEQIRRFFEIFLELSLVPKLRLGNPLIAKLCFATLEQKKCPVKKLVLMAQIKRSRSFSCYGIPKRELGNEGKPEPPKPWPMAIPSAYLQ